MQRCLELAQQGRTWVSPNPMVGCVVVKRGKIVAEGYHQRFGGPHAEILALKAAGSGARNATLVVNLEPCTHHGKTPPCVDAIIKAGIREVVAATKDPNPLVAGSGIRKLRAHRLRVTVGILRDEAEELNEKFMVSMKSGMPFVGVKVAQTLDGRIADSFGRSKWITSSPARAYGHRLRSEYEAVLVGAGTIARDNPELTVRHVRGRNPWRIVLDGRFVVNPRSKVFDVRKAPTAVLTSARSLKKYRQKAVLLEKKGVQVFGLDGGLLLRARPILKTLAELGVSSVLVEGGSGAIRTFLEDRCFQKVHCFISGKILGSGLPAFSLSPRPLTRSIPFTKQSVRVIGGDVLLEGSMV